MHDPETGLASSKVPHDSQGQADMILPLSLARRGWREEDTPLCVMREVRNDRTYEKRWIVIHGEASAEPLVQSNIDAAADAERNPGISIGIRVRDVPSLLEPFAC